LKSFILCPSGHNYLISASTIYDENVSIHNPIIYEFYRGDIKLWEAPFWGIIKVISDELILLFHHYANRQWDTSKLSRIDQENGTLNWTIDLTQLVNTEDSDYPYDRQIGYRSVIGQFENQVWIALNNGDLLCVDYKDGSLIDYLRDVPSNTDFAATPDGKFPILPNTIGAKIIEVHSKLVCFWNWYYWEVDLASFNIDFQNIKESSKELNFEPRTPIEGFVCYKEIIIAVSHTKNRLAAYNRKNKQYEWIIDLPKGKSNGRKLQLHDDTLFVLTGKEVHVYDLES